MKFTGELEIVKFTREDWIFASSFAVSSFLQAIVVTIEGPSYGNLFTSNRTRLAHSNITKIGPVDSLTGTTQIIGKDNFGDSNDASATFVGLLLSYYNLLSFILTPLIGGYVEGIGLKKVYMFGIYIAGLTPLLAVFLSSLRSTPSYLIVSFIIRGVEAVGSVGMQVSIYMMITIIFPAQVASIFAINQAMSVLGFILGGPIVFFIELIGGYGVRSTTFIILGVIYICFAVTIRCLLPDLPPRESLQTTMKELFVQYLNFLKILPILLYVFSLVVTGIGSTFLHSTLVLYIRNYDVGMLGATVIPLLPVLLQLLSPIWGIVLDKLRYAGIVALIGGCVVTVSLLFIGPIPFLPLKQSLEITCTGLVIFGLGQGGLIVSSYVLMIQEANEHNVPEDMVTVTIISSTFVAAWALGGAIGPLLSGAVYDHYGFRYATLLPFILYATLVVLFVVDNMINRNPPISTDKIQDYTTTSVQDEVSPLISTASKSKQADDG